MCCWFLQPCAAHFGISAQQTYGFSSYYCSDYWGLRISEMRDDWAGRGSRCQDRSLGLWRQVTK